MADKKGPEHSQVKQFSLNGHSRPVKMVKYNTDGDMFFTCSDDKLIIGWSNETAEKLGTYEGQGACKSLDVSRHTEYVVGGYAVEGVTIFEAETGEEIFSFKTYDKADKVNYVEFNYGDTELLVLTNTNDNKTHIQIFDFQKLLIKEKKVIKVFNIEEVITQASFGYLNEKLYLSTFKGEMVIIDMHTEKVELRSRVHGMFQIFSFSFSKDYSMLASCGKDFKCRLLHPETLEVIKVFDKQAP
jgi:translation initiation factor 3 subunit I